MKHRVKRASLKADCYRVWLRDPTSLLPWSPVIVALSPEEAEDKALGIFPDYEVIVVMRLHAIAYHRFTGFAARHEDEPAGTAPDQSRAGMGDQGIE